MEKELLEKLYKIYNENIKVYGPYLRKDGRKIVTLYDGVKRSGHLYARIKLEAHLGRRLTKEETVDHIDGDKTNDDILNLQILSRSENALKGYLEGNYNFEGVINYSRSEIGRSLSKKRVTGEKNPMTSFKDEDVVFIRKSFKDNKLTIKEACDKYSVTRRTIVNLLLGRAFSHLPHILESISWGAK